MLGLQDEACVQDLGGARMAFVDAGHAHEVRGVIEGWLGRDRLLAAPAPHVRGQDRRQLRGETDRLAVLGLLRVVALGRVFDRRP